MINEDDYKVEINAAIKNIHSNVGVIIGNTLDNVVCTDKDGNSLTIDKNAVNSEITKLQAEYDAQKYVRNRVAEYPSIAELTIALYDTDDKAAIETKRAAVKKKWPKDNSGPVE